jgi:hypothetical protein
MKYHQYLKIMKMKNGAAENGEIAKMAMKMKENDVSG